MAMAGMVQDGPSCQDIGSSDQLGRIAIMSHPVPAGCRDSAGWSG